MKKKNIIIITAAVVAVALVLTVGIAIGRGMGRGATSTPESTAPPGSSAPQSATPNNSQSSSAALPQPDSIPYVGPIESPIIGRWMYDLSQYYPEQLEQIDDRTIYEFVPDGTVNMYVYEWYLWVSSLWGSDGFIDPIEDEAIASHITQEFGEPGVLDGLPHRGADFSYPAGTPIVNVIGGTVVEVR